MSGFGPGTGERGTVPPGWYYDSGTGTQRWWDGAGWTDLLQPAADGYVAPVRNTLATAGLVLGIVAMVVNPLTVPSLVGVVLSSIALRRANQLTAFGYAPVGRAKAGWGLALSILAFLSSASWKFFLF